MAAKRGVELSAEMVSQLTILHVCGISAACVPRAAPRGRVPLAGDQAGPRGKEELRITITSANTEEQVHDHLLLGFARVRDYLTRIGAPLRPSQLPPGG